MKGEGRVRREEKGSVVEKRLEQHPAIFASSILPVHLLTYYLPLLLVDESIGVLTLLCGLYREIVPSLREGVSKEHSSDGVSSSKVKSLPPSSHTEGLYEGRDQSEVFPSRHTT